MNQRPSQHGFAAIAAIFLVVLLAALGGFMVSFSNSQQISSAQDVQGSRAYWAARGGIEWGHSNPVSACPASSGGAPVRTLLPIGPFSVCVVCTRTTYSDPEPLITIVGLKADAFSSAPASCSAVDIATMSIANAGKMGYVERSVSSGQEALTVAISDVAALEGNAGTTPFTFTIKQSSPALLVTSVDFVTTAGSATAGASCSGSTDYVTTNGTATIAAGATSTTITVTVCGDLNIESDETFVVTLSNPRNSNNIPLFLGKATATGTILNDD